MSASSGGAPSPEEQDHEFLRDPIEEIFLPRARRWPVIGWFLRCVPQEPGLGVRIDERLLRRHGKRFHVSTPTRVALHTIREKGLKAALQLKRAKEGGPTASQ